MNSHPVDVVAALEDFPKLVQKVCASWGRPGFEDFLATLHSAADGGLPDEVAADLSFLGLIHHTSQAPDIKALQPPSLVEMETIEAKIRQADNGSRTIECRAALEGIPRITKQICAIWGTRELDAYMGKLLVDARDGARQGFPVEVAAEILFLIRANKMVRAIERAEKLNIDWTASFAMIDKGDQEGMSADAWDDPTSSRDTAAAATTAAKKGSARLSVSRSTPASTVGSQISGIRALIGMVFKNQWIVGAIILILLAKLLWPAFKALL